MKVYINPSAEEKIKIVQRPVINYASLSDTVTKILQQVKWKGDEAVKQFGFEFDKVQLSTTVVTQDEIQKAESELTEELKIAIKTAASNIEKFHAAQKEEEKIIETMPGVQCKRRSVGIEKVGLYIPGGTAPLFSTVLMLSIPAKLAGCKRIILCTPPQKNGNIHPAVLFAASVAGVTEIFKVGGVQAIAAMAFGTESIPKVSKIFGPGNQYVTLAKQLVQQYGTAIDMPAGPSEVCVLADETANASFIAADLLSQAEHGADSQVLFITTSNSLVEEVQKELSQQVSSLPRKQFAEKALQHSSAVVVENLKEAMQLVNDYAPEHLIIACENAEALGEKVINAGSVFIGNFSPESVGDYASGTNHTLPTNGFATAYSGVSVDSFVRKITYQTLTEEGLKNIGNTVIEMAEAEGLTAHANAVRVRLNSK
jgi:histidinol dehydrogenase